MPITNGDVTHLGIKNVYATTGMIVFGGNPAWHGIASPAIPSREYPQFNALQENRFSRGTDTSAPAVTVSRYRRRVPFTRLERLDSNCAALHPANFVNDVTCPTGDRM